MKYPQAILSAIIIIASFLFGSWQVGLVMSIGVIFLNVQYITQLIEVEHRYKHVNGLEKSLESNVGENIKIWREMRGLSQYRLAKITGIAQSFIARVESNESGISIGKVCDIAEALEVSPTKLVGRRIILK